MAAINSTIHRLTNLPLSPKAEEEEETRYIEKIAEVNGIKVNVPQLIRRKRFRNLLKESAPQPPTTSSRVKWIRLPFLGSHSYTLATELKRYNYRVGFYPLQTIGRLSKDPTHPEDCSGIYKATCWDCGSVYIGQTGRKLCTRIKEHKTRNDSAFFNHVTRNGHDFGKSHFELLHSGVKGRVLNLLQEIETIKSLGDNSLNDVSSTFMNHFIRFYYNAPFQHTSQTDTGI